MTGIFKSFGANEVLKDVISTWKAVRSARCWVKTARASRP
jgi:hypothetical protein